MSFQDGLSSSKSETCADDVDDEKKHTSVGVVEEDSTQNTNEDSGHAPTFYEKLLSSFSKLTTVEKGSQKLSTLTLEGVAEFIREGKAKKIIVLTGAGISTAAGVPDFRSPGTGLYDNLEQFDLPDPMAIFDLDYFQRHPEPFFKLAKDLFPSHLKPTVSHYFIRLLDEKGLLKRWYTQNIDSLELITGIQSEKVVTAHGCHHTSTCLTCKKKFDLKWISDEIFVKNCKVAICDACGGIVKPDIVFFGENLPARFFNCVIKDFPFCDLLIIMGTSLVVHPFAGLVGEVRDDVPRLLINLTTAGKDSGMYFGGNKMRYGDKSNYRDVFWKGTCDDGANKLAELLGWKTDLDQLVKREIDVLEKQFNQSSNKSEKDKYDQEDSKKKRQSDVDSSKVVDIEKNSS